MVGHSAALRKVSQILSDRFGQRHRRYQQLASSILQAHALMPEGMRLLLPPAQRRARQLHIGPIHCSTVRKPGNHVGREEWIHRLFFCEHSTNGLRLAFGPLLQDLAILATASRIKPLFEKKKPNNGNSDDSFSGFLKIFTVITMSFQTPEPSSLFIKRNTRSMFLLISMFKTKIWTKNKRNKLNKHGTQRSDKKQRKKKNEKNMENRRNNKKTKKDKQRQIVRTNENKTKRKKATSKGNQKNHQTQGKRSEKTKQRRERLSKKSKTSKNMMHCLMTCKGPRRKLKNQKIR